MLVEPGTIRGGIKKTFQVFYHIIEHPDFLNVILKAWNTDVIEEPRFVITRKLNRIKSALIKLNKDEKKST